MENRPIPLPPLDGIPPAVIADMIDALIVELDGRAGDADLEPNGDELDGSNAEDEHLVGSVAGAIGLGFNDGPGCSIADVGEYAYPEWASRGRHKNPLWRGGLPHEDAEDDDPDTGVEDGPLGFDPEEDRCLAGDDGVYSGRVMGGGLYDDDRGAGDADDAEREQMQQDVPNFPVFGIEPNPFNGERPYLGMSNLQRSFVSGRAVTCAVTGRVQQRRPARPANDQGEA